MRTPMQNVSPACWALPTTLKCACPAWTRGQIHSGSNALRGGAFEIQEAAWSYGLLRDALLSAGDPNPMERVPPNLTSDEAVNVCHEWRGRAGSERISSLSS